MNSVELISNPDPCFVPLNPGIEGAVAVCVAVVGKEDRRTVPVVRSTSIAIAYLGALCDTHGHALEWVELWFPHDTPDQAGTAAEGSDQKPTPAARWRDLIQRWERSPCSGFMNTGWELGMPRPLVLDIKDLSWIPFASPDTGQTLHFCRDDVQLARAGLPQYSSDSTVFLSADGRSYFQAAGAPVGEFARPLSELLPKSRSLVALSTSGRGMAVRRAAPVALGQYADIIAGTSIEPDRPEWMRLSTPICGGVSQRDWLENPHRSLLRARAGRKEWVAEILALKVRLLCRALQRVREGISVTRQPFLSLSEHSFAVRFGPAGPPFKLWDFDVVLHAAGCAAVHQSTAVTFAWRAARESQMPPPYERSVGDQRGREVECRLRLVTRQEARVLVEATLGGCDEINVGGILGCLHLPLASGRRVLWGRLSRENSLAHDEIRFRSFPADLGEAATADLEHMQGFVWSSVFLDIIPAVGYGDDFHSIGVLAVRLLLTSEPRQLASALDAVFSLIETVLETPTTEDLGAKLRAIFERESRFRELLHPGRAVAFPISGEDAIEGLGDGNWWELLAFVLRLFPSQLPAAFCRSEQVTDLGTFPRAFDEASGVADALERRLTDRVLPIEAMNVRIRGITAAIRNGF